MMLKLCFVFIIYYWTVVQGEPQIVMMPFYNDQKLLIISSLTVMEGDNFLLKCYLMDEGKLLDKEGIWGKQTSEADIILGETYLHFTSVSSENEGIYFCKNSELNLRSVFSLKVISGLPSCADKVNNDFEDDRPSSRNSNSNSKGEPQLIMTKHHDGNTDVVVSPLKVTEGQSITLKCKSVFRRKNLDGEIAWGKETDTSDQIITPNADLYFPSISKDDAGIYFCENSKHNLRKIITVEVKPRLPKPPCAFNDNILNNDDREDSNCDITREPQLVITQLYKGTSVPIVAHVKVTESHDIKLKCVLMVNGKALDDETTWGKETFTADIKLASTVLHLPSVSTDDEGIYFCENSKYNLSKIISLKVKSGLSELSCNFNRDKANEG